MCYFTDVVTILLQIICIVNKEPYILKDTIMHRSIITIVLGFHSATQIVIRDELS